MNTLRRVWLQGLRPDRPAALRAVLDRYARYAFAGVVHKDTDATALERRLRPLLLPNERAADIAVWSSSPYFVAWLRGAWIRAAHPVQPRAIAELSTPDHRAGRHLPSWRELHRLFGVSLREPARWRRATLADVNARRRALLDALERASAQELAQRGGSTGPAGAASGVHDASTRALGWGLAEAIEVAGGAVWGRTAANAYLESVGAWQLLCREAVEALARHLRWACARACVARAAAGDAGAGAAGGARATVLAQSRAREPAHAVVLEVGAGDGQLGRALQHALARPPAQSAATRRVDQDNAGAEGGWVDADSVRVELVLTDKAPPAGADASGVAPVGYRQALAQHAPDVVLCAWMPMGQDWSAAFRACDSVREYVLVGEADFGCCGHNWLTFGDAAFAPTGAGQPLEQALAGGKAGGEAAAGESPAQGAAPVPPYAAAGFSKRYIDSASAFLWERFDSVEYGGGTAAVVVGLVVATREPEPVSAVTPEEGGGKPANNGRIAAGIGAGAVEGEDCNS
eukprot:g6767.t1